MVSKEEGKSKKGILFYCTALIPKSTTRCLVLLSHETVTVIEYRNQSQQATSKQQQGSSLRSFFVQLNSY
jgi:hypothetical protein